MQTITITAYSSMPDRYRVESNPGHGKRASGRDARDAGEAAAVAINYASSAQGAYIIVGLNAVVRQIPAELRSRSA